MALYEFFRERFSSAGLFSNSTHWGRSIHLTQFGAGSLDQGPKSCRCNFVTALNPHKTRGTVGRVRVPGRTGYLVDTKY